MPKMRKKIRFCINSSGIHDSFSERGYHHPPHPDKAPTDHNRHDDKDRRDRPRRERHPKDLRDEGSDNPRYHSSDSGSTTRFDGISSIGSGNDCGQGPPDAKLEERLKTGSNVAPMPEFAQTDEQRNHQGVTEANERRSYG